MTNRIQKIQLGYRFFKRYVHFVLGYGYRCTSCHRPLAVIDPSLHFGDHRPYCAECWPAALGEWLESS